MLEAISIASLPVLYFFSFLFYTDVVSALLVVLALRLVLVHRHWASALVRSARCLALIAQVGLLSLSLRQTNVVWVAVIAAIALSRHESLRQTLDDPVMADASPGESRIRDTR